MLMEVLKFTLKNNMKKYGEDWNTSFDACDICGRPIKGREHHFYHGKTKFNTWALMCPKCFIDIGTDTREDWGFAYDGMTGTFIEEETDESPS